MDQAFLRRFTCGRWEPTEHEMHGFLDSLLATTGEIRSKSTIAFLVALAARPLVHSTIVNFVSYVRKVSPRVSLAGLSSAVNIVGTGGGPSTFNISTTAAFVASAAGAAVVKSGSRAYSSESGSMDVLRALGVTLPTDAAEITRMLARTGLSFVSEAHSSPLLRRLVMSVQPLNFRDVGGFINAVGPFLCPYQLSGQVLGVAHRERFEPFVSAATELETARTLVVQSDCGMDELCSVATNRAVWADSHGSYPVPVDCGEFAHGTVTDLAGSGPVRSAGVIRGLLSGMVLGPKHDTVVLNAAAVLLVAGLVPSIADGVWLASRAITSGAALAKLEQVIRWNELPAAEKTSGVRASSQGMAV